jgi:hypothetical protein
MIVDGDLPDFLFQKIRETNYGEGLGTAVKHKPLTLLEYFEEFFYFNLF